MKKLEKLTQNVTQTHKVNNATGKMEPINLLEVGLPQIFNVLKKKKYL